MNASDSPGTLFCFGFGYSARRLARELAAEGWRIVGTGRTDDAVARIAADGFEGLRFNGSEPSAEVAAAVAQATHVLSSVPPGDDGDSVLLHHGGDFGSATWVGYLSTTGVYGDTDGATVDEGSPLAPTSERSRRRVGAEAAWLALTPAAPVHVFRLAGIYGPGRSMLDRLRAGTAQRILKPGHRFSRIHVDDIAQVLRASMARPDAGAVYNVTDDKPAAPSDVVAFAARLLERVTPGLVPFDEAKEDMSPMALSFWRDNRIVDNQRIKERLGVDLRYPDFKAGLAAIFAEEKEQASS